MERIIIQLIPILFIVGITHGQWNDDITLDTALTIDFKVRTDHLMGDLEELIKQVLPIIPSISSNPQIQYWQQTIGTVNFAFKVQIDDQFLMVRINSDSGMASLLADRNREITVMGLADHYQFGGKLYAKFTNGYIVSFIKGNMLELEQLKEPFFYSLIAQNQAFWHSINFHPSLNTPLLQINPWDIFTQWSTIADQLGIDIKSIKEEINKMEQYLLNDKKYDDRSSFTHNDLNHGNIIYNEDRNHLAFVDYEFSGLGNRYFDIANHFCEWCGNIDYDLSRFPTKEQQLDWLKIYISHYDKTYITLSPEEQQSRVSQLWCIVNSYELISHLFWGFWGKLMASKTKIHPGNTFDYDLYSQRRLNSYYTRKSSGWPPEDCAKY